MIYPFSRLRWFQTFLQIFLPWKWENNRSNSKTSFFYNGLKPSPSFVLGAEHGKPTTFLKPFRKIFKAFFMLKNSSKKKQKPAAFLRLNFSHTSWLFFSNHLRKVMMRACNLAVILPNSRTLLSWVFVEGLQDFTDRSPLLNDVWWMMMYRSTENIKQARLVIKMTYEFYYRQYNYIY